MFPLVSLIFAQALAKPLTLSKATRHHHRALGQTGPGQVHYRHRATDDQPVSLYSDNDIDIFHAYLHSPTLYRFVCQIHYSNTTSSTFVLGSVLVLSSDFS